MKSRARRGVLDWIERPADPRRALHVGLAADTWVRHDYGELSGAASAVGTALLRDGVKRNDVLVIVASPGLDLVAALFGTMLAGGVPTVVATPRAFRQSAEYPAHLRHMVDTLGPRMILVTRDVRRRVEELVGTKTGVCSIEALVQAGTPISQVRGPRADLALLQFTGGSTGRVRGVRIPFSALEANVSAIRRWLNWTHRDGSAFWVPHYHDMGLIGGLITPLVSGGDLWLLTPGRFVRKPIDYLRCFGQSGASLTALPAFGLDYMVRRVDAESLAGLDFSHMKAFVVGAELIDPATLRRFSRLLAPHGLPEAALLPAYGLAEATLAVTAVRLGEVWDARPSASGGSPVVTCGRPVHGVEVSVVDESGHSVAEGEVGEIVIRGASLASGYLRTTDSRSRTAFERDGLRTGDAGFLSAGELFPVGRFGDSIKVRGQVLFAEQLETRLWELGHPRERNAVVLGVRDGRTVVAWISESAGSADQGEALGALRRLVEGGEVSLVRAGRGTIPRTSSGKPRRHALWRDLLEGRLMNGLRPSAAPPVGPGPV